MEDSGLPIGTRSRRTSGLVCRLTLPGLVAASAERNSFARWETVKIKADTRNSWIVMFYPGVAHASIRLSKRDSENTATRKK